MTTQNKVFLKHVRDVYEKVLAQVDYRGYPQSMSGGCTMCHGTGLVSKDSIPTNSYRDSGAGATGGKRKSRRKRTKGGNGFEMPVGVIPKRYQNRAAGKSAGRKTTKGGRKKTKGGKKTNPWLTHVMKFKRAHPNLSYSEVLKKAKSSYKK